MIRRAEAADIDEYVQTMKQCYGETRFLSRSSQDDNPSKEGLLSYIEEVAASNAEIELVALCDRHIVGYGNITACLNRLKMMHKCDLNVSVLQEYWGLGIGKSLVRQLIEFARAAGYEQVNLSVASDNERAIGLYESLGFIATGREIHAMKHAEGDYSDFVFMTKFLK